METGTIEVIRYRSLGPDLLRAFRILIDGQEVGTIRSGGTKSFDVPAGPHSVVLTTNWMRSPIVTADVAPGERLVFDCGPNVSPWWGPFSLIQTFRKRAPWIRLERAQ